MEDKGRYTDSIFVEWLWRTGKYEEVYLKAYFNRRESRAGLDAYFHFYNTQSPIRPLATEPQPRCSMRTRYHQMTSQ